MSRPERTEMMYEGKAKQIFATTDPDVVWIHFKDDATAFDGAKKAVVRDKGEVNCRISAHLMQRMEDGGVPTHLIEMVGPRDQLAWKVEILPIEVVVRNYVAGSASRRFGRPEGERLPFPMIEFFYKDDALHDPPCSEVHALTWGWATEWEMAYFKHAAALVNAGLQTFWDELGVTLVDFKIEFGRRAGNQLLLADEITPDGSRLWEKGTMRKLDKDVFRRDLGDLGDTYRELFERVFGHGLSG